MSLRIPNPHLPVIAAARFDGGAAIGNIDGLIGIDTTAFPHIGTVVRQSVRRAGHTNFIGHLPGATLILWQDLYADQRMLKFKTIDEIRALLTQAGVTPNQSVVTYCAVGMRASLMYWAARAAGIPARVYVGSWQDWQRDSGNPIVK